MLAIMTRAEAIAYGEEEYFTGEPCKYGHLAPRAVENCACMACSEEDGVNYRMRRRPRRITQTMAELIQAHPRHPDISALQQRVRQFGRITVLELEEV